MRGWGTAPAVLGINMIDIKPSLTGSAVVTLMTKFEYGNAVFLRACA